MRWVARAPNVIGGVKNSIFDSFRSPAPKLALVPASRLCLNIDICPMKFCVKSHQD